MDSTIGGWDPYELRELLHYNLGHPEKSPDTEKHVCVLDKSSGFEYPMAVHEQTHITVSSIEFRFKKMRFLSQYRTNKYVWGWREDTYGFQFIWDEKPNNVKAFELAALLRELKDVFPIPHIFNRLTVRTLTKGLDLEVDDLITHIHTAAYLHHFNELAVNASWDEI